MRHPTHFAFRIVMRTNYGRQQLAGSSDFATAIAAYRTACECWPDTAITLREGARVIEDSRRTRLSAPVPQAAMLRLRRRAA